jgi:hypothetical protein
MAAEGVWVILGTAIGAIGSMATTFLNAWLTKDRPDYFDRRAMKLLTKILSESTAPWHDIRTLSNVIGCSQDDTRQLLLMIGARGHESGSGAWALVSRVGTDVRQRTDK